MDRAQLSEWLVAYERAWRTPGTEVLADLFTEDASYSTAPYENPHRGLAAIARMWEEERASADEDFSMSSEIIAVDGEAGVVRVGVRYRGTAESEGRANRQRREYRDLWVVQLNDAGLCFHFEEWPFWPPGKDGAPAAGGD